MKNWIQNLTMTASLSLECSVDRRTLAECVEMRNFEKCSPLSMREKYQYDVDSVYF